MLTNPSVHLSIFVQVVPQSIKNGKVGEGLQNHVNPTHNFIELSFEAQFQNEGSWEYSDCEMLRDSCVRCCCQMMGLLPTGVTGYCFCLVQSDYSSHQRLPSPQNSAYVALTQTSLDSPLTGDRIGIGLRYTFLPGLGTWVEELVHCPSNTMTFRFCSVSADNQFLTDFCCYVFAQSQRSNQFLEQFLQWQSVKLLN